MPCTGRRRAVIEPSMKDENSPNADKRRAAEVDPAGGSAPSITDDDRRQAAARIEKKLREVGFSVRTLEAVSVEEAIVRSDRIVVASMLTVVTVLAWCYLLWLSGDMAYMRSMDMSDFR